MRRRKANRNRVFEIESAPPLDRIRSVGATVCKGIGATIRKTVVPLFTSWDKQSVLLLILVCLQSVVCFYVVGLGGREFPVNVTNSDLDVTITNREVPVNLRNHYITRGDPINVRISR